MERHPAKNSRGFVQITDEQLAIPLAGRDQARDLNCLTPLEKLVLQTLTRFAWKSGGRIRRTNLEIGLAIGMQGDANKIARKIMHVISGRASRGGRLPGLKGKGFVTVHETANPRDPWQREIELTAKWTHAKMIKMTEVWPEEATPGPFAAEASPAPVVAEASPAPVVAEATAAVTAAVVAAQFELPTPEQREAIFGKLPRVLTRPELAEHLVKRFRDRLLLLSVLDGVIKVQRVNASATPITEAEAACLKWLRDEVIIELSPKPAPEPARAATDRPAPKVANPGEVRALIGRLSVAPAGDDTVAESLADRLVAQFRDSDPERSRQTYLGLARDVAQGELAPNILNDAFEEACKPRKTNRGAAFVAEVKRLKAHIKNQARD